MPISQHDADEVTWYLVQDAHDQRSTFGPQLDHASLFYVRHAPDAEHRAATRARQPWEPDPNAITARPTAEARETERSEPDCRDLIRKGRVSRRLAAVSRLNPISRMVLELYYGDVGALYGRGRYGRVAAVFALTRGGKELARDSKRRTKGAKLDVTDAQRVKAELDAQEIKPDEAREVPIMRAMREAEKLYELACDDWNETAGRMDAE